ncbi:hypothetical protein LguiA_006550 [Lonicera macranthoides]
MRIQNFIIIKLVWNSHNLSKVRAVEFELEHKSTCIGGLKNCVELHVFQYL